MEQLLKDFYDEMQSINLNVYGILDADCKIHTLGTDSKLIGRIFEMFAQPILEKLAKKYNLSTETPEKQTFYPDFILLKDKISQDKVAIDIKTTYIDTPNSSIKFTLGSFGSYMRNNTKNIAYKYTDYAKHYVIGFVYMRNDEAQASNIIEDSNKESITCPYKNVKYFIQEKYKIAGDKPGSGNTENIGSFSTNSIDDLINGNGPFSELGQDLYDIYWKYYPKYRAQQKNYTSLEEFLNWIPNHFDEIQLFHAISKDDILKRVKDYKTNHCLS